MYKFAATQMRSSLGRLIAATIAIALGTGFVSATIFSSDILAVTARNSATIEINNADVVISGAAEKEPEKLANQVSEIPTVAGVDRQHRVLTTVKTGNREATVMVSELPTFGKPPKLKAGRLPTNKNEIALAKQVADTLGVKIGDQVTALKTADNKELTLTNTGIFISHGLSIGNDSWAAKETVEALNIPDLYKESEWLFIYGKPNTDPAALAKTINEKIPGSDARTSQEFADDAVASLTGDSHFLVIFGLCFAAVAIAVSGMVIANTFEVLVAQRVKTLALLRCGGATKSQVRRSVLIEASLLGLAGSAAGVVIGIGFGVLATYILSLLDLGIATPGLSDISLAVVIVPIITGLVVTVLAAIKPANAATQVSPVAALRPIEAIVSPGASLLRAIIGSLVFVTGLVMMIAPAVYVLLEFSPPFWVSIENEIIFLLPIGVFGGLLTVTGFLILSVFLVPPLVQLLGNIFSLLPGDFGNTARLATANANRNPRRTAATASALVIGVGLVTMMATGAAIAKQTMNESLNRSIPVDITVRSFENGLSENQIASISKVSGVIAVEPAWGKIVYADGYEGAFIVDLARLGKLLGTDLAIPAGHVGMRESTYLANGSPKTVVLSFRGTKATLPVTVLKNQMPGLYVPKDSVPENVELGSPEILYIDADDSRSDEVFGDIQQVVAETSNGDMPPYVDSPAQLRNMFESIINALLAVLLGLLAIAVVIALVGVANTLSLSVVERRRENGMLRAVGATNSQLRTMLATEGVLIALAGAAIGTALGILSAVCGTAILLGGEDAYQITIDWLITPISLLVAILAGLIASVLPARSALKVPVVTALAEE